jgi:hypothetical protein
MSLSNLDSCELKLWQYIFMSIIIETAKSERATERYEGHPYPDLTKLGTQTKTAAVQKTEDRDVNIVLEDYSNELGIKK